MWPPTMLAWQGRRVAVEAKRTRLTNSFSKKFDNLMDALYLHFAYYNFCRIHKTLRVTPAMEAGITNRAWSIEDIMNFSN